MIIGIDIGSTSTKAVSIQESRVIHKIKTKALDAVTSATGAFGKMIVENGIKIGDIRQIMITGAGAGKLRDDLFGIPTGKADEIQSIGIGGMYLSGRKNIIIANVGTGTAIIDAGSDCISHLGGSGVGGGTILGLAKKLLSVSEFSGVMRMAEKGKLSQVDLLMEDIMETDLSFLNRESTASNFGKMLDSARSEDIALGIINMVYQVIGMLSVFAAKSKNIDRVVVTGNGSGNVIGREVLKEITAIHRVQFEYPENAEYTTAFGAALSCG
jgi:type II pantothenate kinase